MTISPALVLEQTLNGLQYGVMLFLMAAGLTLVFGIMNLVNLAHGSLYMVGAYLATALTERTGSFVLGVTLALPATLLVGVVVEIVALRTLYERDHLDQVLATFGLILFFNELVAMIWGRAAIFTSVPPFLSGHFRVLPSLRIPPIERSSFWSASPWPCSSGSSSRARAWACASRGASNRTMIAALGVDIRLLYTLVFGLGAALAGLAGAMAGPVYSVQPGMGEGY
jgi:branched-chain amino acid transport system permease protein